MKRVGLVALVACIMFAAWILITMRTQHTDDSTKVEPTKMQITSPAFANNEAMPQKYGCQGEGINPPLQIKEVPADAKAMALVVDDPDAPGGTFDHWVVWGFAPQTSSIAENSVPAGAAQGANGSGKLGYMGPCPPSGVHHYHFKLYALDGPLTLKEGASKGALEDAMKGHIVGQTELVGTYEKR